METGWHPSRFHWGQEASLCVTETSAEEMISGAWFLATQASFIMYRSDKNFFEIELPNSDQGGTGEDIAYP